MESMNEYILYELSDDKLPNVILNESFDYEFINNWRELRINIFYKGTGLIMHTSALYKFSFFLIQTRFNFNPIIGDSKTNIEARGMNLYSFALKKLVEFHFSKSKQKINALVLPNNDIPNKKLPKIGFKRVRLIRYIKLFRLPIYIRLIN
jgi:hypothetical protein